jgi:hypothetical protein
MFLRLVRYGSSVFIALGQTASMRGGQALRIHRARIKGMTLTSAEYLAKAIGAAIGGGGAHQYEATSTSQHGKDIEQWAIVVFPGTFYWSSKSLRTGRIQSFDPETLSLHTGEESISLTLDRIPRSFPEAVMLAFPLSLPIWGRDHDEYHPISVEEQGNDVVLMLRHQKDKALFGSYTFDGESGRAKRFVTPMQVLQQEVLLPNASNSSGVSFGFVSGTATTIQEGL